MYWSESFCLYSKFAAVIWMECADHSFTSASSHLGFQVALAASHSRSLTIASVIYLTLPQSFLKTVMGSGSFMPRRCEQG